MLVTRDKIQSFLLFVSHFLSFSGYYVFLMILSNLGMIAFSRGLTIPLRIFILICLAGIILVSRKVYVHDGLRYFLAFAAVYISRILFELMGMKVYSMDASEFLLYFLAFGAFPLLLISCLQFREYDYKVIQWSLIISGVLLGAFTILYYRSIIGTVGRISMAVSKDENYISPLALSYCGTLTMGIGINYLLVNKVGLKLKLFILAVILVSVVPFFLGASRGSIFALFVPFFVMFLAKNNPLSSIRLMFIMIIVAVAGIYLSTLFGSSLVNRFTNIESDIQEGKSSAVRLQIWKDGLNQFFDSPIFGDSLEVATFKHYPHNIIIEVLLTTGIIGFIPFLLMLLHAFKKVMIIYKTDPANSWIAIIFIQSFLQNMFSGSLYTASWLWASLGLLYSFETARKHREAAICYN